MPGDDRTPLPQFQADYDFAQQVAAGDDAARQAFMSQYGGAIYETCYQWCSPHCRRAFCPLRRKQWTHFLEAFQLFDCDKIQSAYAFFLDQLLNRRLARYRGRTSLKAYLFDFLSSKGKAFRNVRADWVRHEIGKFEAPTWVEKLAELDRRVYEYSVKFRDESRVAQALGITDLEVVRDSRRRIEKAARADHPRTFLYWQWTVYGGETSIEWTDPTDPKAARVERLIVDQAPTPAEQTERDQRISVLREALSRLSREEQTLFRLRCGEHLSLTGIAARLAVPYQPLYKKFQEALAELQEEVRKLAPGYPGLLSKELVDALESLLAEPDAFPKDEAGRAEFDRDVAKALRLLAAEWCGFLHLRFFKKKSAPAAYPGPETELNRDEKASLYEVNALAALREKLRAEHSRFAALSDVSLRHALMELPEAAWREV